MANVITTITEYTLRCDHSTLFQFTVSGIVGTRDWDNAYFTFN